MLALGPLGWRNWRAFELGTRSSGKAFEVALYSDATFIAELRGLGPYDIFNLVVRRRAPDGDTMQLVLRTEEYGRAFIEPYRTEMTPSRGSYHGGSLADEISALLSLALGVRCQAGEIIRRFDHAKDRGSPSLWYERPHRMPAHSWEGPMLPGIDGEADLRNAQDSLQSYTELQPAAATALTRAARQYQSALWNADSDPNTSWLQLVAAVEVAASHHAGSNEGDPWGTVTESWPALADALRPLKAARRHAIAELVAPGIRAGAKYRRFLRDFHPPTPEQRPAESYARINWSKTKLSKAINTVYTHRSNALHAGVPFPPVMSSAPRIDEDGVADERLVGLGVGSGDAYWDESEIPMHLHVYAYIVRHALLAWWRSMTVEGAPKSA